MTRAKRNKMCSLIPPVDQDLYATCRTSAHGRPSAASPSSHDVSTPSAHPVDVSPLSTSRCSAATPGAWLLEALRVDRALLEQFLEQRHGHMVAEFEAKLRKPGPDWAYCDGMVMDRLKLDLVTPAVQSAATSPKDVGRSSRHTDAASQSSGGKMWLQLAPPSPPAEAAAVEVFVEDAPPCLDAGCPPHDELHTTVRQSNKAGERFRMAEAHVSSPKERISSRGCPDDESSVTRGEPLEAPTSGTTKGRQSALVALNPIQSRNVGDYSSASKRGTIIKKDAVTRMSSLDHAGAAHVIRKYRAKLARCVQSPRCEIFFTCLIFLNAVVMAVEAQYLGIVAGQEAKLDSPFGDGTEGDWPEAAAAFKIIDFCFGAIFTVELLMNIAAYGQRFPCRIWNLFDLVVVTSWFVNLLGESFLPNPLILRMIRIVKASRLLRLAKSLSAFDSLHLMLTSLRASMAVASWSLMFLLTLTCIAALAMNYMTKDFIVTAEVGNEAERLEIYVYFGTFTRSLLSMIEITIGNWAPITRAVQEYIGSWLAFAVLTYQLLVGFACVRVITGVFLHETFKVAGNDDEMMILSKHREVEKFKEKIGILFEEADESGDGIVSYNEFDEILGDARMREWLGSLGLEVSDAQTVWETMDSKHKGLSIEELVHGIQKIKGNARSLDMVSLRQRIEELSRTITKMEASMVKETQRIEKRISNAWLSSAEDDPF